MEDLDWVRTQENRDKSDRWMRGNVLPSIDEHDGRMVIVDNWLHTDGLMARLKNKGIFAVLEFPLLRDGPATEIERRTWLAKYLTQEVIDRKREELGDIGFRREMLLQVDPRKARTFTRRTSAIGMSRPLTTATTEYTALTWLSPPRKAPTTRRSCRAR